MEYLRVALENLVSTAAEDFCFLLDYGFTRSWATLALLGALFAVFLTEVFVAAVTIATLGAL